MFSFFLFINNYQYLFDDYLLAFQNMNLKTSLKYKRCYKYVLFNYEKPQINFILFRRNSILYTINLSTKKLQKLEIKQMCIYIKSFKFFIKYIIMLSCLYLMIFLNLDYNILLILIACYLLVIFFLIDLKLSNDRLVHINILNTYQYNCIFLKINGHIKFLKPYNYYVDFSTIDWNYFYALSKGHYFKLDFARSVSLNSYEKQICLFNELKPIKQHNKFILIHKEKKNGI